MIKISQKITHYLRKRPLVVVVLIFLVWSAFNLIWIFLNKTSPHLDMSRHLYNSLIYAQELNLKHPLRAYAFWVEAYQYYPPLMYVLTKPFYLFSFSIHWALISNILWLGILLFSLYGIGKTLWNKKFALVAVILLAATPIFIGSFKEYMLDAPLAAWISLTVYLMLRSNNLANRPIALILGLVLGLGMLLKWTYIAFILFPLSYLAISAIVEDWKSQKLDRIITLCFVILTFFAIASPWYFTHRHFIYRDFIASGIQASKGPADLKNIFTWLYYPIQGLNFYFFLPLGLIIYCSFALSIIKKKFRNWFLIGSVIIAWLIFTILPNKDIRYFIPALPFFILLAANVIGQIKFKKIILVLVVILALFYQMSIIVGWNQDKKILFPVSKEYFLDLALFRNYFYTTHTPSKENWHNEEIVQIINSEKNEKMATPKVVLSGPESWNFNFYTVAYYSQLYPPGFDLRTSQNDWTNAQFGILSYNSNDEAEKWLVKTPLDHPPKLLAIFEQPKGGKLNIYDLRGD